MEVEPGEHFEIEEDCKGQINCEETQYKLIKLKKEEVTLNQMNGTMIISKMETP
jgi:hypothetical protein